MTQKTPSKQYGDINVLACSAQSQYTSMLKKTSSVIKCISILVPKYENLSTMLHVFHDIRSLLFFYDIYLKICVPNMLIKSQVTCKKCLQIFSRYLL